MTPDLLILRFGELWLKGANRKDFIDALARRLRAGLKAQAPASELVVRHDRMEIRLAHGELTAALDLAKRTPGIVRVVCAHSVDRICATQAMAVELVGRALSSAPHAPGAAPSFRASRRPISALRCALLTNRLLAGAVMEQHPLPIDLRRATLTLGCEVAAHGTLVTQDEDGCGGLPVGSAGKTLLLLSGGIDSPVAGHQRSDAGVSWSRSTFTRRLCAPRNARQGRRAWDDPRSISGRHDAPQRLFYGYPEGD